MRTRYFYKAVRILEGGIGFGSIYAANPQKYFIGQRIDCPYMFVYAAGEEMGEFLPSRAKSGDYALLKVRTECKPHVVWLDDVSWAIHGPQGLNPVRVIKEASYDKPFSGGRLTTLLDSLTPVEVVDISKLNEDEGKGMYLAPSRRKKIK